MDRDSVKTVVRATLMLMTRIAKRTRTQADDLLTSILQANEERLVDALVVLLSDSGGAHRRTNRSSRHWNTLASRFEYGNRRGALARHAWCG